LAEASPLFVEPSEKGTQIPKVAPSSSAAGLPELDVFFPDFPIGKVVDASAVFATSKTREGTRNRTNHTNKKRQHCEFELRTVLVLRCLVPGFAHAAQIL
jgi:hypothetical protein